MTASKKTASKKTAPMKARKKRSAASPEVSDARLAEVLAEAEGYLAERRFDELGKIRGTAATRASERLQRYLSVQNLARLLARDGLLTLNDVRQLSVLVRGTDGGREELAALRERFGDKLTGAAKLLLDQLLQ